MTTVPTVAPLNVDIAAPEFKDDRVRANYHANMMLGKFYALMCLNVNIFNPQQTTKHRHARVPMADINTFQLVAGYNAINELRKALEVPETPTYSHHRKQFILSYDNEVPYGSSALDSNTNKTGGKMPNNTDHFVVPSQAVGKQVFIFWTSYLGVDPTLCDDMVREILNEQFTTLKTKSDMKHVIVIMTTAMHRFYSKYIPDFDTNFASVHVQDNMYSFFTSMYLGYNEKSIPIKYRDTITSNLPIDNIQFRLVQGSQIFDFRGSEPGKTKYYEIKTTSENTDGTLYFLVKLSDPETLPVLTLKSGENIPITIVDMPNAPALIEAIVDNDGIDRIKKQFTKQGTINEKLMLPVLKEYFNTIDAARKYVSMETLLALFLTQEPTSPDTKILIDHAKMLQEQMYNIITYYIAQYQRSIRTTPSKPLYTAMPLTAAPSFGFVDRQYTCPASSFDDEDPPSLPPSLPLTLVATPTRFA
jgi:hypothetical protein